MKRLSKYLSEVLINEAHYGGTDEMINNKIWDTWSKRQREAFILDIKKNRNDYYSKLESNITSMNMKDMSTESIKILNLYYKNNWF